MGKHSTRNREFDASRNLIVFKMEEIGIKAEEAREDPVSSPSSQDVDSKNADLDDLYSKYKKLQQQLEFLQVQEEYIKDEQRNLKKEYLHAQEEVKRIQSIPLVIGQFLEAVDQNTGIVGSTTGSNYYVRILSTLDRELLKPSEFVQKYLGEGPRMVRDVFR